MGNYHVRFLEGVIVIRGDMIAYLTMLMPVLITGFGNWMVPIQIGAPDMAFVRRATTCHLVVIVNNRTYW